MATQAGGVVFEAFLVGDHHGRWLWRWSSGGGGVALGGAVGER